MTRRFTVEYTESHSQTVQARLELSVDDPPVRNPGGPTVRPVARAVVRYPEGAPSSLAETEDDE